MRSAVLHALSLRTDVRHFVLFSSISGLLGSRWLAHYTATSTFLDTFAYARRNLGLPATVVNWGLWKSLADLQTDAGEVMSNAGLEPMPDEVAIRALPLMMGSDAPVRTTVVDADWPLLAAAYRTRGALRIVDDVLARRRRRRRRRLRKASSERNCANARPKVAASCWPTTSPALASAVIGLPPEQRSTPTRASSSSGWIR